MEAPLYTRSSSQRHPYIQPENQLNHLDDRILQLILWTMNNCETQDVLHNACPTINNRQNSQHDCPPPALPASNILSKENKIIDDTKTPHVPENHRKVSHHCLHSLGPPPRPFKKARYAWEIKNYDYTLRKMTQNMNQPSTNISPDKQGRVTGDSPQEHKGPSNFCPGNGAVSPSKTGQEERNPEMHMLGPTHQGYNVGHFMSTTSYHAHYGAVMGANTNHQNSLPHGDRINSFHAQVPPDPDARLIRWHTRQLCRSIFDNTVNRMLENMGFSPVTERSQALHPLLVLSLSDDEEREAEEARQRTLETQVLSAALHQKGLLPPPYHYDPLESATTSDYDSSEEDSELGEGAPDELAVEQPPAVGATGPQNTDEEAYFHLNSNHPSFGQIANNKHGSPFLTSSQAPIPPLNRNSPEMCNRHFSQNQNNLCDYQKDCDANDSITNKTDPKDEKVSKSPSEQETDSTEQEKERNECEVNCISRCQSLECNKDKSENGNSLEKKLKVDDNENCIASPKPETLIEGKVERVLDNCHTADLGLEGNKTRENNNNDSDNANNNNNNDSYFIRNAIQMAMKQQGLGFQRA